MFKRKKQDKKLKEEIYKKLKTAPEKNFPELHKNFLSIIKSKNKEKISTIIRSIKSLLKDKIPAKPKFYTLLLLKEIIKTKENYLISYFIKKLKDRLSIIANYKTKLEIEKRGEDCLDIYYSQKSEENKKYSKMFYDLLLECWEHWDVMFSKKYKKIKEKVDKIRLNFKLGKKDVFYNFLEHEGILENKEEIPNLYLSNIQNTFNTNNSYDSSHFSNKSGKYLKTDLIKKELENDKEFRFKLTEVVSSIKNCNDFPFEDFEYFDRTISDQLMYFRKNENIVKKNGQFDEIFLEKFFKDFEITNNLKTNFEGFKRNQDKEEFISNLKIILESQNKNSEISGNFNKKPNEYFHDDFDKIQKNKEERNKIFKKFELQNEFPPIEEDSREFNESKISRNFQSNIYSKRKSNLSFDNSKKLDDFSKDDPIAINFKDFDIEEEEDSKFSPRNTMEWRDSSVKNRGKHTKSEVYSSIKKGEKNKNHKSINFSTNNKTIENLDNENFGNKTNFGNSKNGVDFGNGDDIGDFGNKKIGNDFDFDDFGEDVVSDKNKEEGKNLEFDDFENNESNGFGGFGKKENFGNDDNFGGDINFGGENNFDGFGKNENNGKNDFDGFGDKNRNIEKNEFDGFGDKNGNIEKNDFDGFGNKNGNIEKDDFDGFGDKNEKIDFDVFTKKNNKKIDFNNFGGENKNDNFEKKDDFGGFGNKEKINLQYNNNNFNFDFEEDKKNEDKEIISEDISIKKENVNFDDFSNTHLKKKEENFGNEDNFEIKKKDDFDFKNDFFEENSKSEISKNSKNKEKSQNPVIPKNDYFQTFANLVKSEKKNKKISKSENLFDDFITLKKSEKKIEENNESNKITINDDIFGLEGMINIDKAQSSKNISLKNSSNNSLKNSSKNSLKISSKNFNEKISLNSSQKSKKRENNNNSKNNISIEKNVSLERKQSDSNTEISNTLPQTQKIPTIISSAKVTNIKKIVTRIIKTPDIYNSKEQKIFKIQRNNNNSITNDYTTEGNLSISENLAKNQFKENSELKVENEYLKNRCDILIQKIVEVKNTQIHPKKNNPEDLKSNEKNFEKNIFTRKNEFLNQENEMLSRLNKELVSNVNTKNLRKSKENLLLKDLIIELQNYINNLQSELKKERKKEYDKNIYVENLEDKVKKYNKEFINLKKMYKNIENEIHTVRMSVFPVKENFSVKDTKNDFGNFENEKRNLEVRNVLVNEDVNFDIKNDNDFRIEASHGLGGEYKEKRLYNNKSEFFQKLEKKNLRMSLAIKKKNFNKKKNQNESEFMNIEEKDISEHFSNIHFDTNKIEKKKSVNNLDNSFLVYKMFYDNLNKKKTSLTNSEYRSNPKHDEISNYLKSKKNDEISNYRKSKKSHNFQKSQNNQKSNSKNQYNIKSSKISIKEIINSEIENSFTKSPPQEITQIQNPVDEPRPYFNSKSYPNFKSQQNQITLKASSLFENSVIFENTRILIKCKTSVYIHRAEKVVNLNLTYFPLEENLKISTHILSYENIDSNPPYIINQFFDHEISQSFTLKIFGDIKKINFQKLQISIFNDKKNGNDIGKNYSNRGNYENDIGKNYSNRGGYENERISKGGVYESEIEEIFLPLPFTINKFIKIKNVDSDKLDFFLSYCENILDFRLILNKNIIDNCFQIIEIFPNAIQLTDTLFLLFLDFGSNLESVVELNIVEENLLDVKLHAKIKNPLFYDFVNWFIWIFK